MTFLRAAMLGALVLAGLLSAVGVPARANEVVNPGFETGALTPWFQIFPPASMDPADWAVTSSDVHSGSFSAADDGNRGLRQDLAAPIPNSNIAEVSFWIRHPNSANAQAAVDLFYSDATSNEGSSAPARPTGSSTTSPRTSRPARASWGWRSSATAPRCRRTRRSSTTSRSGS